MHKLILQGRQDYQLSGQFRQFSKPVFFTNTKEGTCIVETKEKMDLVRERLEKLGLTILE